MNAGIRRVSYAFLCVIPFLNLLLAGARPLRVPGIHQAVGVVLFTAIVIAAWIVGASMIASGEPARRLFALAGALFLLPMAMISLLWVGIGAPFQATPPENYMRFLVLVAGSISVTSAFVCLKEALHQTGERFYSTAGFAANAAAGVAYLICLNLSLAHALVALHGDKTPPPPITGRLYEALEFVACLMTYLTTAIFSTALGQVRILGRGATRGYVAVSAIFVVLLLVRGLEFPEISSNTAPWYTRPGVIAGIPAIPWLMPSLLGAVLLMRAREEPGSP